MSAETQTHPRSTTPLTQAKVDELIKPVPTDWYQCYVEMIQFSGGLELQIQELNKKLAATTPH